MGFPIDGNLYRVADDVLRLTCSAAVRKAGLHGGEVLQQDGEEVGENEQQWTVAEGQSRFILSG
jgi:hypothetical protein